jgi:hypothetical protein
MLLLLKVKGNTRNLGRIFLLLLPKDFFLMLLLLFMLLL